MQIQRASYTLLATDVICYIFKIKHRNGRESWVSIGGGK